MLPLGARAKCRVQNKSRLSKESLSHGPRSRGSRSSACFRSTAIPEMLYPAVLARDNGRTQSMRKSNTAFVGTVLFSAFIFCAAQASFARAQTQAVPTASGVSQPSDAAPAAGPVVTPAPAIPPASTILQPSLDTLQQTLAGLNTGRWKRGSVRDEAIADINSIQQDMQMHVGPLLKDADAAPGALSKSLPVSRHVDALYD